MNASSAPIQIRRTELVLEIRDLAALKGLPITDAVADAVRAELRRVRARKAGSAERKRTEIDRLLAEIDTLPVIGPLLSEDDLYDGDGLPR